jgi:hypothetical protein
VSPSLGAFKIHKQMHEKKRNHVNSQINISF